MVKIKFSLWQGKLITRKEKMNQFSLTTGKIDYSFQFLSKKTIKFVSILNIYFIIYTNLLNYQISITLLKYILLYFNAI